MEIHTQHANKASEGMVLAHLRMLETYKKHLEQVLVDEEYTAPESSLRVPFDKKMHEEVTATVDSFAGEVKTVLLVGIGGSDMGTRAIYDALRGHLDVTRDASPRLITVNTVEPKILANIEQVLASHDNPREIALVVVSKSGKTTETIANANILFTALSERFSPEVASSQTIVITDKESPLAQSATEKNISLISFPSNVGGRYSVFTAVGLVPLTLLGFDTNAFIQGAQSAIGASVSSDKPSSAAVIASFLFEAYLQGSRIHELFIWHPELETLGKWYRQLLAESIGKERKDGTKIGFTPTIEIGSIDLHSVGQLIFGGRNDRFTTFISASKAWDAEGRTYNKNSPFTLDVLENKKGSDVMQAILGGVRKTYETHNLPYISIEMSEINERELGAFMALHMTAIMFLAQIFDINAFDQPAVETYKKEVRRLLSN